ncbi:unnamed protein product [Mycena citricolor]|uniref:Uncharacterized protein n=1 Tax=Mycena citricolor TaxID=2018698 RepID=A0AAD2JZG0_9AGAR|nr:unnamed protein product [Mycena citricolor]CAK5270469.1 unnamed protein product [Mycena citricolor]
MEGMAAQREHLGTITSPYPRGGRPERLAEETIQPRHTHSPPANARSRTLGLSYPLLQTQRRVPSISPATTLRPLRERLHAHWPSR